MGWILSWKISCLYNRDFTPSAADSPPTPQFFYSYLGVSSAQEKKFGGIRGWLQQKVRKIKSVHGAVPTALKIQPPIPVDLENPTQYICVFDKKKHH